MVERLVFGHSSQGRDLVAYRSGASRGIRRILIVGVIHGDETAGLGLALDVLKFRVGPEVNVLVVPDLNPDGVARGTRQNVRGVDLNRNFPYRWRRLGVRGDQQYAGAGPLSEPESRAMVVLIRTFHPTVSVWFHQPIGVVDDSGGAMSVESRFARIIDLPFRRLARYPGSATSWENTVAPGTTAFVVELPREVTSQLRARLLSGLRDLVQ